MIVNDSLRHNQYFIEQQIPKNLQNTLFENKLKLLKKEQDFFRLYRIRTNSRNTSSAPKVLSMMKS